MIRNKRLIKKFINCLYRVEALVISFINFKEEGIQMKKFLVALFLVAIMAIGSIAWATPQTSTEQTAVWEVLQTGTYDPISLTDKEAKARAWHIGGDQGECDKKDWPIDVHVNASIAQWIKWNISSKGWNWQIRKPGTYVADCIGFSVKSNEDVAVTFSGFDDLVNDKGEKIETYYGIEFTSTHLPQYVAQWVHAPDLNNLTPTIPMCEHSYVLWNKLVIREDPDQNYPKTRACEYQDDAQVKLTLTVIKDWIDPDTGNYKQ